MCFCILAVCIWYRSILGGFPVVAHGGAGPCWKKAGANGYAITMPSAFCTRAIVSTSGTHALVYDLWHCGLLNWSLVLRQNLSEILESPSLYLYTRWLKRQVTWKLLERHLSRGMQWQKYMGRMPLAILIQNADGHDQILTNAQWRCINKIYSYTPWQLGTIFVYQSHWLFFVTQYGISYTFEEG